MNKNTIFVLCCLWCLSLSSCHISYVVRNQHEMLAHNLYFICGRVGFELEGKGDSKFIFRQKFDLDAPVTYYPDSVKIYFNDSPIEYHLKNRDKNQTEIYEKASHSMLELAFETTRGVFDGDSIIIFATNYIKCNDQFVGFDTISYTFKNRLRIYGVNAL